MSNYKSIKTIFLINYIILFSGIGFSLYYAYNLFIELKENSAKKNLITINKLATKNVNDHLKHISNSVITLGNSYKKLYEKKYEYIQSKPIYKHRYIKNDKIVFYNDNINQPDYAFKSNHVSMVRSNLKQNREIIAKELNIFHQITPALASIHNSFNFSWVYITTVNNFVIIYPYLPYINANEAYKPTEQHFYKAANFKDKQVGWEEPYKDLIGEGILITASYPIYSDDNVLLGVASHDITVDKIASSILNKTTTYKGSITFLLSKQGKIISSTDLERIHEIENQLKNEYRGNFYYRTLTNAHSDGLDNIFISSYNYLNELGDEIIAFLKHTKNIDTQIWNSEIPFFNDKLLVVSSVKSTGWILVSYVPKETIIGETETIFYRTLLILSIFITILFAVSGFLTMKHLIIPLEIINRASKKFGDGFSDVKVHYSMKNLLSNLFNTFNIMVDKIELNNKLLEQKVDERTKKLQEEIGLRKKVEEQLRLISRTDSLTGIWNRGYFCEMLEREVNRSHRFGLNMSILMIDIDFFKKINDTWGHSVGDDAINHLVKVVNANIRKENIFGRLGGEEFGIVLIETKEPDTPLKIAQRIRKSVQENPFMIDNKPSCITISVGIANINSEDSSTTLYNRSDKALYLAKENGRNRVEEIL